MIKKCNFVGACASGIALFFGLYILTQKSTSLDLLVNIGMLLVVLILSFLFGLSFWTIGTFFLKERRAVSCLLTAMISGGALVGVVSMIFLTTDKLLPELVAVLGIYFATLIKERG